MVRPDRGESTSGTVVLPVGRTGGCAAVVGGGAVLAEVRGGGCVGAAVR